ncbi:MAG: ATP-binding cassette domain-containing protein [Candidatus Parvarchaeota archaeon]|nr:ATP-binding cassette domain-containing protein [Candidatus Parvarchaeota archaeon]
MEDLVLKVRNLSKNFGSLKAVNNVSFSIKEGEIFGFLGPNGAGKTTTIKMLTTLISPTSGDASILGHSILKEQTLVRSLIGVVPQEYTADEDITGYDNLLLIADLYGMPRKVSEPRIMELMSMVELTQAAKRKVSTYSGGMRRRLELAIGLVNRPKILFLDEPTLGLDVQTRSVVWKYIRYMKEKYNMTLFLTTHYLEEADALCDRIAIIDHGRIIKIGTPEELKESVGGDIVEISIKNDDSKVIHLIRGMDGIKEVKRIQDYYRVKVKRSEELAPKLISTLLKKGYTVQRLSLKKPSLDEVYLDYTGRSLRDEESSGEDIARIRRTIRTSRM